MHFYFYFFRYIFSAKTRQKLLFIAVVGLFISTFSLVVLQGIMGGLQNGLIERSKKTLGRGHVDLALVKSVQKISEIELKLKNKGVTFSREYEIELMVNHGSRVNPVILHGIDFEHLVPSFLENKDLSGVVLGSDLATNLNSYFDSKLTFISPAHIDYLINPIPRSVSEIITDFYVSDLAEIDSVHAWTRLSLIQNLIRKRLVNKLIFYTEEDLILAKDALGKDQITTWEQQNKSLVWALNLETNVMLFLFIGMSLLVAICITSGFMIFFDKIKTDLISYWVMGKSQKDIYRMSYIFTHIVSLVFCSLGIIAGLLVLELLNSNNLNLMPDFFVERRIPVKISSFKILLAFIIPYSISVLFSYFSFSSFKKDTGSFIKLLRQAS
jgi:lipoprotein-releasing system permease protein